MNEILSCSPPCLDLVSLKEQSSEAALSHVLSGTVLRCQGRNSDLMQSWGICSALLLSWTLILVSGFV